MVVMDELHLSGYFTQAGAEAIRWAWLSKNERGIMGKMSVFKTRIVKHSIHYKRTITATEAFNEQ